MRADFHDWEERCSCLGRKAVRLNLMGKEWCVLLLRVIECVWIEGEWEGWISGKIFLCPDIHFSAQRYFS